VDELSNNQNSDAVFYFLLRTVDRFNRLHQRNPGTSLENYESDLIAFKALFHTFLKENNIPEISCDDYLSEMYSQI
jgi:hypothetical protein